LIKKRCSVIQPIDDGKLMEHQTNLFPLRRGMCKMKLLLHFMSIKFKWLFIQTEVK